MPETMVVSYPMSGCIRSTSGGTECALSVMTR